MENKMEAGSRTEKGNPMAGLENNRRRETAENAKKERSTRNTKRDTEESQTEYLISERDMNVPCQTTIFFIHKLLWDSSRAVVTTVFLDKNI